MFDKTQKWAKILFVFIIMMACLSVPTMSSMAAGRTASDSFSRWRPDDSASQIYKPNPTVTEKAGSALKDIIGSISDFVGGVLGALFAPFIKSIGDALFSVLGAANISLDSVIFGRVGGMSGSSDGGVSADPSIFTFELTKGNLWGTVSMFLYQLLMSVFMVLLLCAVLYRFLALIYSGSTGRARVSFKSTIQSAAISVLAIVLMPKLLDLFLYIRDLVLYVILDVGVKGIMEMMPDSILGRMSGVIPSITAVGTLPSEILYSFFGAAGSCSLTSIYRASATTNLFSAIMYLASVLLALYLAFVYISLALTMSVLVIIFPFICVLDMFSGGGRLKDWLGQMIGLMTIPVIDAILLMFPITAAMLSSNPGSPGASSLVVFIMCCSIVPARTFIRQKCGFGSASGLEMAGIGSTLGALRLAATTFGAIKGIKASTQQKNDQAESDEAAAKVSEEISKSHDPIGKQELTKVSRRLNELSKGRLKKEGSIAAIDTERFEKEIEGKYNPSQANSLRARQIQRSIDSATQVQDGLKERKGANAIKKQENDRKAAILRSDIRRMELNGGDRQLVAGKRGNLEKIERESARLSNDNAILSERIRGIEDFKRDANGSLVALKAIGGEVDTAQRDMLDSMADIKNFELPQFRSISIERRAELQRARAATLRRSASAGIVTGTVGTLGGAAIGSAASMMLGPTAHLNTAAFTMGIGAQLGEMASDRMLRTEQSAVTGYKGIDISEAEISIQRSMQQGYSGPGQKINISFTGRDNLSSGGGPVNIDIPVSASGDTVNERTFAISKNIYNALKLSHPDRLISYQEASLSNVDDVIIKKNYALLADKGLSSEKRMAMLANEANRAQAEMYADYVIASGMIDTRELDRFAYIYDDGSPQADRYDITRLHNFIVSSSMHSNSERMQEYVKSGVWSV